MFLGYFTLLDCCSFIRYLITRAVKYAEIHFEGKSDFPTYANFFTFRKDETSIYANLQF